MSKPKYFHTMNSMPAFVARDGVICLLNRDNRDVSLDDFLVDDLITIRRQWKASEAQRAREGAPPSSMRHSYVILRDRK